MLKKTAIALGLAMVASTGMAAGNGMAANSGEPGMANGGGSQSGATTDDALKAEFNRLDSNHDGVLSRKEASASQEVSSLYDSLDTNATIENGEQGKNGITLEQFEAGMQAKSHGGTVGRAVSGGQTYVLMKNGQKRAISNTQNKNAPGARQPMRPAGESMPNGGSEQGGDVRSEMSGGHRAMQNSAPMRAQPEPASPDQGNQP